MKCYTYLRFVSQPNDPSVVPLLSTGAPIDGRKARILLLEVLLTLDHFDVDARALEDLPYVLCDSAERINEMSN